MQVSFDESKNQNSQGKILQTQTKEETQDSSDAGGGKRAVARKKQEWERKNRRKTGGWECKTSGWTSIYKGDIISCAPLFSNAIELFTKYTKLYAGFKKKYAKAVGDEGDKYQLCSIA